MPTDRLTIRSTMRDKKPYDRKAAADMLITPPSRVASKM
jgi:hypothetical protein